MCANRLRALGEMTSAGSSTSAARLVDDSFLRFLAASPLPVLADTSVLVSNVSGVCESAWCTCVAHRPSPHGFARENAISLAFAVTRATMGTPFDRALETLRELHASSVFTNAVSAAAKQLEIDRLTARLAKCA